MKTIKFLSQLALTIGLFASYNAAFSQVVNDSISTKVIDTILPVVKNVISPIVNDSITEESIILKEPSRLKFACGFGLNFVGGTNISISPNLIYSVSDKIAFGAGIQGSYAAIKDLQSTTTYGVNTIMQYNPSAKITTLLEFVQLRVSTKTESTNSTDKYWDSALFVGAGYNITSKIAIGAKYNMLYNDEKSVYSSPIIPFVNISF